MTALSIDAQLAEAHAVLAKLADDQWDWSDAQTGFYFATSLDADDPTAHHWYSVHLGGVGRFRAALEQARAAAELEPDSGLIQSNLALLLARSGLTEEALLARERADQLGYAATRDSAGDALVDLVQRGSLDAAFARAAELARVHGFRPQTLWRPEMAGFREDPRFPELVRAIGLVDYWRRYGWADACRPTEAGVDCG
jgi:tetratricopeptide (TPR) repeat protein